jgi:hypothetical protein
LGGQTSGKTLEEIDYIFVKYRGHSNELIETPESSIDAAQKSEGQLAQIETV